ncbi:MAG: hypothetical protein K0U78_14875 [Actinomycetia bacterium]|nr:hypothetical protein [Actinomycetes bacterium]
MANLRDMMNRNVDGDKFPLLFAKRLCVATGLWEELEEPDMEIRFYQNEKLKEFQQMSITCKFEDCLIAYHGDDLTEDNLEGLRIIHKATKSWLKGEVVGTLMNKINDKKITNRDFAASVAIIMDQLDDKDETTGNGGKRKKELVVRMAKMEDVAKLAEKKE